MNRQNVEIKARIASLAAAREVALQVATDHVGVQRQVDTYFSCPHGRLKLREIDGQPAQLVWYSRPDLQAARVSDYILTPVHAPAELKESLARALGVRVVVDKRREIFLADNVRIHLDRVAELGDFIEFEAVLASGMPIEFGERQVAELSERFGLSAEQLVECSYADMLEEKC